MTGKKYKRAGVVLRPMPPGALTVRGAAARIGVKPSSWRHYVHTDEAPKADGWHDGRTPWWLPESVDRSIVARRRAARGRT